MNRIVTFFGAVVLAAGAIPAGAQRSQGRDRDDTDRTSQEGLDTTVTFAKGGLVSLSLPAGDIVVTGWAKDQVHVRATTEGDNVRFNATASRINVELEGWRGRGGDTRYEVSVPTGTRITARTQSGEITIRGTKGEVEATSQSGDVRVEEVTRRLDVSTLSGEIQATGVAGDADLKSVSGDVRLHDVNGDLDMETVSGEIEIRAAVAKQVRAHTTSGDVLYEGSIDPQGRYELVSHSGDVRLGIPRNTGAQLTVSTWSGSVDSDFPITLKPGERGIGLGTTKRFTFEIGNAAARITLESFSGDITINADAKSRR